MRHSKRSLEGYVLIDNRHAPPQAGLSDAAIAAFEQRHGPLVGARVPGGVLESAVLTCAHCQAQIVLNPQRSRPRAWCAKCDKYVCDHPRCVWECRPLMARLDRLHDDAARRLVVP